MNHKTLTRVGLALVWLSAAAAAEEPRVETQFIKPDDVRPGMKGYGLTVVRGTEPERFEIEVVGQLYNAFPRQDMILIRCTGDKVEHTGVASGMSGSPIFITDKEGKSKLMGALAYGWSFQREAIAGVTPITNMMDGMKSKPPKPLTTRPQPKQLATAEEMIAAIRSAPVIPAIPEVAPGQMRPVRTPLMVSGVPPHLMSDLKKALSPFDIEPVQGGSRGRGGKPDKRPFRPGDAIGVQLMRGDEEWTAIGTVTHVEGKRILAFGHPFLSAGPWQAPVTRARVEWVMASNMSSFKMATPTGVIGRLIDDIQPCIVAELGPAPAMVPLSVSVGGSDRDTLKYNFEVVRHQQLTAILAMYAALDSVYAAYPYRGDTTLHIKNSIVIKGHGSLVIDTIEPSTASDSRSIGRLLAVIARNPFKRVEIERADISIDVEIGRKTARLISARTASPNVEPGSTATIWAKFRPYGGPDEEIAIRVPVPENRRGKKFAIKIVPAGTVMPDVAPPSGFDDYLKLVRAAFSYPETSLAVITASPTRGIRTDGRVMPALPSSVMNVLRPSGTKGVDPTTDYKHQLVETKWVVSGGASVILNVLE